MDQDTASVLADLLPRAFRSFRRRLQEGLGGADLAPHQARALRVIDRAGPLRAGELARLLRVAPRSATEVIDALQARGLVERAADPSDRRAWLIRATPAAAAAIERHDELRRASMAAQLAALSEDDQLELIRLLRLLTRSCGDPSTGAPP